MAYVISGTAGLHKTHVSRVGYSLCDPDSVEPRGFDINCSLVCFLKQPFISGMASFFTYREDCNGDLINTRMYAPNMFYTTIGCPSNYNEESLNNGTWVGTSSYTVSHGVVDGEVAGYRIKIDVIMNAISEGKLSVSYTTSRLMPGSLEYVVCNSVTMDMTETKASMESDGYDARYYEAPLMATSFDDVNCGGEVKYVKGTVVLMSYHFGCSTSYEPSAFKCNLRTRRGGFVREYSCLVGLAMSSDRTSWSPQVVQLGVNPARCAETDGCGCYYWDGYALSPSRSSSDLAFVGCPSEYPSSNIQRIQTAIFEGSGSGSYQVVLKSIGLNAMCVAARLYNPYSPGSWVIGSLTYLKYTSPLVMQASFPGLPGSPVFQFYGMEFPTAAVEDCQVNPIQDIIISDVSETPDLLIEQNKKLDPVSDANLVKAREMVKRIFQVKQKPCVSLGMALEEVASCGCGGSVLHECKKHGTCRQSGNDEKVQLCWKCSDYSGE